MKNPLLHNLAKAHGEYRKSLKEYLLGEANIRLEPGIVYATENESLVLVVSQDEVETTECNCPLCQMKKQGMQIIGLDHQHGTPDGEDWQKREPTKVFEYTVVVLHGGHKLKPYRGARMGEHYLVGQNGRYGPARVLHALCDTDNDFEESEDGPSLLNAPTEIFGMSLAYRICKIEDLSLYARAL